jgi:hypothetical protein
MRWFRANVRVGAWCALVAMVLQLALTFGHVHASVSSAASPRLTIQSTIQGSAAQPERPRAPLKPLIDHCATCAVIHLAGAGLPPAAISLPLPLPVTAARLSFSVTSESASSKPVRVRARGPPLA